MNIGIYGGAFDPPHMSHVWAVGYALSVGHFDEILVVPCWEHSFGKQMSLFGDRLEMSRRAFALYGEKVLVSSIEFVFRSRYTYDLLHRMIQRQPQDRFTLIIGEDEYAVRHKWHNWDGLMGLLDGRVFVIGREGAPESLPVPAPRLPAISSSSIREEIRRTGSTESVKHVVPVMVTKWIREKEMYGLVAGGSE